MQMNDVQGTLDQRLVRLEPWGQPLSRGGGPMSWHNVSYDETIWSSYDIPPLL